MPKILEGQLPNPTPDYNFQQFNEMVRVLENALHKEFEREETAEEREAIQYFLGD